MARNRGTSNLQHPAKSYQMPGALSLSLLNCLSIPVCLSRFILGYEKHYSVDYVLSIPLLHGYLAVKILIYV